MSATFKTPFAADLDWSTLEFGKVETDPTTKRKTIDVTLRGRKPLFSLCRDEDGMLPARYALDVGDPGKEARRGQCVWLEDEALQTSLKALEEVVLRQAVEHSTVWFQTKEPLSEEVVRSRFNSFFRSSVDGRQSIKFKVKCPPSKVPTDIFLVEEKKTSWTRGTHSALEKPNGRIWPELTLVNVWFMSGGNFGLTLQAEKMLVIEGAARDPALYFAPLATTLDWSALEFDKVVTDPVTKRKTIDVKLHGRRPRFSLCSEGTLLSARYTLDMADPGKEARRGQCVWLEDEEMLANLKALEETVLRQAVEHSTTWFQTKEPLSEEVIRSRFNSFFRSSADGRQSVKFKVKCPPSTYPTDIFLLEDNAARGSHEALEKPNALLRPEVTLLNVWFMSGGNFGLTLQAEKMSVVEGAPRDPLGSFATKRQYHMSDAARRDESAETERSTGHRDHHEEEELKDVELVDTQFGW